MKGVILSDLHSGHLFGLTSSKNISQPTVDDRIHLKAYEWQTHVWDWFSKEINSIGKIDRLIINGDAIEGKGERSGATELITADRGGQIEIAKNVIETINFKRLTIVRGTPSHTGEEEDWEDVLADRMGVQAQDHAWLECNGIVMDIKHHIGSTSVPGAIPPALPREAVWNLLWAEKELQPRSNVFIRSHLHKFYAVMDDDFIAMVTPALQGWTKYGGKQMSKTISYGFISYEITEKGAFRWTKHLLVPRFAAAKAEAM